MKLSDIKERALSMGLKPGKLGKTELIRTIQKSEGNFDCFASGFSAECGQDACLWREDCINADMQMKSMEILSK